MKRAKTRAAVIEAAPKRSEIITNCVIYAQSMAAYHAGFKVDNTGDSDHAGCHALGKKHFRKADRAVARLIGLSPVFLEGKPPLSRDELFAKAGVLGIMTGSQNEFDQTPTEKAFVRFFAAEVADYLRAQGGET